MTAEFQPEIRRAQVPVEREWFMRALIRELAGTLEEVIGIEETDGYMSVVGSALGAMIDRECRGALALSRLDRSQIASVLVDLKRRIAGDFYIISKDDEKIVLGNRACPFGPMVEGRPSMCMMTSNVFGSITANHLGYCQDRAAGDDRPWRFRVPRSHPPAANPGGARRLGTRVLPRGRG